MTSVCPAGHSSESDDYCDVCGIPIQPATAGAATVITAAPATPTAPATSPPAGGLICPNCTTPNVADALFCEACGYDFTTGTMPRPVTPASPLASPEAGAGGQPDGAAPSTVAPDGANSGAAPAGEGTAGSGQPNGSFDWVAEVWIDPAWYEAQDSPDPMPSPGLPDVVPLRGRSLLVGRTSVSRNIHPEVDCSTDTGVSRRQAQLTTDGSRWWVEDLESANGTFVGPATGAIPDDPIPVGVKRELNSDDRVYVGAWTRLVIRRATDDEQATLAG
jgi:FHA domain